MQPGTLDGALSNCMSCWGRRSRPLRLRTPRVAHAAATQRAPGDHGFPAQLHGSYPRASNALRPFARRQSAARWLLGGRTDGRFADTATVDHRPEEDDRVSIRVRPVLCPRLCRFPTEPCRPPNASPATHTPRVRRAAVAMQSRGVASSHVSATALAASLGQSSEASRAEGCCDLGGHGRGRHM